MLLPGDLDPFFALSPDVCCVMGTDGTIHAANAAWSTVLGYASNDVVGAAFFLLVHSDDRARVQADLTHEGTARFGARVRSKDGQYRLLHWTSTTKSDARKIFAIGHAEPTTLGSSERLLSLGQIALGVVHDLKNVLVHPLGLHLQRMERGLEAQAPEKVRAAIGSMRDVLDDGQAAIDRMLQFTQPRNASTRIRADVENLAWRATEIARAYARSIAPKQEIELAYDQGRPKRVDCDSFELLAALVNVLFNAIDAVADAGGKVIVRTGTSPKRVWLEVVDNGPGMSTEVRDRIFEPFFTTKRDGIGIGLAMVKKCIESHAGTIEITSAPGAGTTFRIELPASPAVI
ncbi:MAG TPA: PAS domain-containing sensor histidine kinase [Kofleriaceae bacterium]|nr:PAS domain-containing sensor histidine kinase [Kofleriaceae bacterium]